MTVYNKTRNAVVSGKVDKAEDFKSRLAGLIPRRFLGPEEGLWIGSCASIHMLFMKFAIDAVFLDKNMRVVRIIRSLKPWRFSPWVWGADSVLELPAGRSDGRITEGDTLEITAVIVPPMES
ncbi:MAG: DUF192 domain-containing protein [bacterium]